MSSLKLQFVIDAVDRATGVLARVDRAVDRATAPVRRLQAQWQSFSRDPAVVNAMDRLVQTAQPVMAWGRTVASVLGVVASAGAGVVFALDRVVQRVSSVADQAVKLGMTTEQLTRLQYAAQQAGASPEQLVTGLTMLSDKLTEARQGSKEAVLWLSRVGITTKDLNDGIGGGAAFLKLADFISNVADTAQNSAAKISAFKALMSRDGASLIQLANSGSKGIIAAGEQADRMGITLISKTAAAMKDYGDKTQTLGAVMGGVWTRITAVALPSMNRVVDRLIDMTAAGSNSDWVTRMGTALGRLVDVLPDVIQFLMDLVDELIVVAGWVTRVVGYLGGWNTVLAVVVGVLAGNALVAVYGLATALGALALAVLANPIGFWITAIAAGAALIISNWTPLKEFFKGLWDTIIGGLNKLDAMLPSFLPRLPEVAAGGRIIGPAAGQAAPSAVAGAAVAPAVGARTGAPVQVGGQLSIKLDTDGRVKSADLKKAPGSPMDIEVAYNGGTMPL